jgi:hypothetical protein
VCSDLALPEAPELGAGQRTRRITTTVHVGHKTTRREQVVTLPTPVSTPYARLKYEDDAGPHTYEVSTDTVTIGRGGIAHRVDVRVQAAVDVSREHLRIRRDPQSGKFFVADLSSLGSTVNGKALPKGDDVALPNGARIGLAETVYLVFELAGR